MVSTYYFEKIWLMKPEFTDYFHYESWDYFSQERSFIFILIILYQTLQECSLEEWSKN